MLSVYSLRDKKDSSGNVKRSAADYFLNLAQDDYYTKGGEPPGQWFGRGAEQLGLHGMVLGKELRPLLEGFHPVTKKGLVKNAGNTKKRHMPCWDLTFSAPKSVSLLWAMSDREARQKIQELHYQAVTESLRFVEDKVAKTNRGYNGLIQESPAGLVVSTFEHSTSRDQDPLLHTHCLVANVAPRKDGTWGALEGKYFFDWKMATGAYYRSSFSNLLQTKMGLSVERDASSFRLSDVPKESELPFSQRRNTIKQVQKERGVNGSEALAKITLETRNNKGLIDRKALFDHWQQRGKEQGFGSEESKSIIDESKAQIGELKKDNPLLPRAKLLTNLTEQSSVFKEQHVYRLLAEESQCVSAPEGIEDHAYAILNHPDVLSLRQSGRYGKYEFGFTTTEMRNTERAMVVIAKNRKEESSHRIGLDSVNTIISDIEQRKTQSSGKSFEFSEDQKTTIQYIFNSGGICCVRGKAGAGKSTSMEVIKEVYEHHGYNVFGVTFSGKATAELKKNRIDSQTLDSLFVQIDKGYKTLSSKDVLILDEAGMVGSKKMFNLMTLADEVKAKVVLVGDNKQLQPLDAGGAFKAVEERIGSSTLSTNFRQKTDWQKEAVECFEHGDALKALEIYAQNDSVFIEDDREKTLQTFINHWKESITENPLDEHLMIVNTRLDVESLNILARQTLLDLGSVEGGYSIPTKQGKKINIGKGDTLLLKENSRMFDVYNGDLAKVISVNISKNIKKSQVRVQLESGKLVTLPVGEYSNYDYGYAVTTYKSQGSTIDHTFVLVGNDGLIDRENSYVQNSRHSKTTKVFLDRESLEEHLDKLKPTEAMIEYAENLSESKNVELPDDYEDSFRITRQFLDEHSKKKYGFKEPSEKLKGIEGLVRKMNRSNQKITSLDYSVISKVLYGDQSDLITKNVEREGKKVLKYPSDYDQLAKSKNRKSSQEQKTSDFIGSIKNSTGKLSYGAIDIQYKRPYWDKDFVIDQAMNNVESIIGGLVSEEVNQKLSNHRDIVFGKKGSIRVSIDRSNNNFGLVRDFERGYTNNIIGYVSEMTGKDWYDSLNWVANASGLNPLSDAQTHLTISPEVQQRREALKRGNEEKEARRKQQAKKRAQRIYSNALPIDDTLAETYLREHRGISADLSRADFKYHPEAPDTVKDKNGDIKEYLTRPALVVGIRNKESEVVSAQLIYLDPNTGEKNKDAQVAKRTIASSWGYHAQVHQGDSDQVILAEGPETAASLINAMPDANIYISVGNNQNMGNLDYLAEKHGTHEILFASDNDGVNAGSNIGLKKAADKLESKGIVVKNAQAPSIEGQEKTDYNDVLVCQGDDAVKSGLEDWHYLSLLEKSHAMPDETSHSQEKISTRNQDYER